jgi:phosphoribosylformimino-5-aminoimidazole carboxamide ribotide isomerase
MTKEIIKEVGFDRITLAFDVRINEEFTPTVATLGWQKDSGRSLWEILGEYYSDSKMPDVLCTDIDRDGLLKGPNFSLYSEIIDKFPKIKLQASGGVRSVEDVVRLKREGLSAVITGKAIYEKRFTLDEVLKC